MASVKGTGERKWILTDEELPREMTIRGGKDGIQVRINYLTGYLIRILKKVKMIFLQNLS